MSVTINGTSGVTFNDASNQTTAATGFGFKNRLINSAMVIDQRNAGASVTISTAALNYTLDRWAAFGQATDGIYTVSRSTTVPSSAGFVNSLVATCTTADTSISATNRYFLNQNIEGNNSADLRFGTADAQAITLSFWVRSSLTGTYCAAVLNGGATRAYVAEYTISTADTWEYKTITVPGDTTGTWSTNETTGITLRFALAGGSTYQTTANAWAAGNFNTTTNQVNWMSSSSSRTFYITGVQLEKGSTATSFDYRPYGTELALCMRYAVQLADGSNQVIATGQCVSASGGGGVVRFPVEMRAAPTITASSAAHFSLTNSLGATAAMAGTNFVFASTKSFLCELTGRSGGGLTAGDATLIFATDSAARLLASAEL
jgi:hypothetical protein